MNKRTKEELIKEYKEMRVCFFNTFEEDLVKFEKKYGEHPLYDSVVKHFDKSFTAVNQIAELEINNYLNQ